MPVIILSTITYIVGLIILYFIVKHAVRTGVVEAMREVLREYEFKAKEKD